MMETNIQFVLLLLFHFSAHEHFLSCLGYLHAFELQIGENHACFLNVQYI